MQRIIDNETKRRTRLVDQAAQIRAVVDDARNLGTSIKVAHGGGVANSYGYAAVTSVVGTVAIVHNGVEYVFSRETAVPANKVTLSGASEATLDCRMFDGRMSDESERAIKSKLLCRVAAELGVWE